MKIKLQQFAGGKNMSWAHVGYGIARGFKAAEHEVHIFSTDGNKYLPADLKDNLIGYTDENVVSKVYGRKPDPTYDCQISYTAMKNFSGYLSNGTKNRFGIWAWEFKSAFPTGFAKHHLACDYVCPPSQFCKQVFMEAGIPERKIQVIPHGIDRGSFEKDTTIKLPTTKSFKILANIAQNHLRKNIPGLLTAYGKAFTNKDDVCLLLKVSNKPKIHQFDISLEDCLTDFYCRFPQHAEIKRLTEYYDDMSDLYRSIDAVYTMTHGEGYYMPGLEALAAGKLNIAPNWGGQLDFLNANNALLIDGKEGRANPKSMYWESKTSAVWFEPSIDDAVEKLRYARECYQERNQKLNAQRHLVLEQYDWSNISRRFMELCQ